MCVAQVPTRLRAEIQCLMTTDTTTTTPTATTTDTTTTNTTKATAITTSTSATTSTTTATNTTTTTTTTTNFYQVRTRLRAEMQCLPVFLDRARAAEFEKICNSIIRPMFHLSVCM